MSSTKTRTEQREARTAALAALKRREQRQQRIRVAAVLAVVVGIFAVVAAVAVRGLGGGDVSTQGEYYAGKAGFRLPGLLDDRPVELSDYAGTPVVVNFFASWCVYCNEELPGFVQVARATEGQVQFVGVDTNDTGDGAAMARRFDLAGAGFALAHDIGAEPASDLWRSYGGQGLPVTAFFDADGRLVEFGNGMLTQDDLEQRLRDRFGIEVDAASAADLAAPVIPLIPRGAYELLAGDQASVPVDLRAAGEFARGHLERAVNVDPSAGDLADAVAGWDTSASYFLYDADGSTVAEAADRLHRAGFKHVYTIEGGYAAWVQAGGPTTG